MATASRDVDSRPMTRRQLLGAAAGAGLALSPGVAERNQLPIRAEFVQALSRLRPVDPFYRKAGISREKQVIRRLGKPDDVVAGEERDRGSFHKVLRYGTNGHRTLATLGEVFLDERGRVLGVVGIWGSPPDATLIPESELRMYLVDRVRPASIPGDLDLHPPSPYPTRFWDTAAVITVVNRLRPLGKEKILAVLGEYSRVTAVVSAGGVYYPWRDETVFAIMAVLFTEPNDPHLYGRYLWIVVRENIPILMPYRAGGAKRGLYPRDAGIYQELGQVRSKPLRPSDSPLRAVDQVQAWAKLRGLSQPLHSEIWRGIRNQILLLVAAAYQPGPELELRWGLGVGEDELERRWRVITEQIARARLKWDASRNQYVRGD